MKYDVIIPARNEERTIGAIVRTFKNHPSIQDVIVVRDDNTADNTSDIALGQRAIVAWGPRGGGKGQNIKTGLNYVTATRVILCDGDLEGLTLEHIDMLIQDKPLIIGIPDIPLEEILCSPKMTWGWIPQVFTTYAWVSGVRAVDTSVLKNLELYGYLTEVQINSAYLKMGIQPVFHHLRGLYSPFRMSDKRMEEMERDRKWGIEHGVFGR